MDQMETTIATINKPIPGRHVPYCLENGDTIIQNDIILVIDQHDSLVYACQATTENLMLLKVISTSASESSASPMLVASDSEPQVIDSNQITKSSGTKWSKDAVLFLIEEWQKNSSKFASTTIRNDEVWKDIAKALENAGFTGYTWKQAQDKWKNIRKGYMKVKDNIGDKSSGAPRITCKFFDELDDVFRKSPSVEPISIASSRNSTSLPSEDTDSDSDKNFSKYQPKKKKTKLDKDTLTWMSTFRDDAKARETAREERHQQTLKVLNKAVDTYETVMQKLIDKL